MTFAVCYCCGNGKHGAFSVCENCGRKPQIEEDIIMSLAMTDHYFKKDYLEQMGLQLRSGYSIDFSEGVKEKFRSELIECGLFKRPNFLEKLFCREKPPLEKDKIKKVNIVPSWLRKAPLLLVGSETYKMQESSFGFALIVAKTSGWNGGDMFFRMINQNEALLLPFFTGAGIWNKEAINFSDSFWRFVKSAQEEDGKDDDKGIKFANTLFRLCGSGGFKLMVGDI